MNEEKKKTKSISRIFIKDFTDFLSRLKVLLKKNINKTVKVKKLGKRDKVERNL